MNGNAEQAVLEALGKRLGIPAAEIDPDAPLRDLPAMESVVMLHVVVDVEDALDVTIPDDVAFSASTPRELAGLVTELV
ncbi:acyl carrier protein [Actinomadura flavalba]|uniref:acyl carrier protein n=1 Tax=Actinomadura flavalba TaxID=1120938 RepID=UPI00035DB096|nr:acyl carrier protein [Actinomadura flavalba]